MAEEFFEHIKSEKVKRESRETIIPNDMISMKMSKGADIAVKSHVRGWEETDDL